MDDDLTLIEPAATMRALSIRRRSELTEKALEEERSRQSSARRDLIGRICACAAKGSSTLTVLTSRLLTDSELVNRLKLLGYRVEETGTGYLHISWE